MEREVRRLCCVCRWKGDTLDWWSLWRWWVPRGWRVPRGGGKAVSRLSSRTYPLPMLLLPATAACPCSSLSKRSRRYRALDEAADADLGPGGQGRGGSGGGSGGEAGFGGVEGAMVGINSVHVALSSVSAIQVGGWGE